MAQVRLDQPLLQCSPAADRYSASYPEWNDKPYSFANFLQAARFANSLQNGRLLSKEKSSKDGFNYVTYKVRLSRDRPQRACTT